MVTCTDNVSDSIEQNTNRQEIPSWIKPFEKYSSFFIFNAPGKPLLPIYLLINTFKILTVFVILGMMQYYDHFTDGAWVYLALQGVYGYCWIIKDFGFRDPVTSTKTSLFGLFSIPVTVGLPSLILAWLFMSNHVEPSGFQIFVGVALQMLGICIMIAGDCQRHFTLKHQKGLITTGMFRYTRNPNYFGETLIYGSFAWMANHWFATLLLAYWVLFIFFPRFYRKDYSISRHPGWDEYKATSGIFVPWAWFNGRALKDLFSQRS